MTIRAYQAGDDVAQVSIYNEAAGELPKFKPATLDEVRRRSRADDFDPTARFCALADGRPAGYATFQLNGRVSFPWCRKGCESLAEPLLEAVLAAMRARGMRRAWSAYRGDWQGQCDFFLAHGFGQTREMLNFSMDLADMPTPAARSLAAISPLTQSDLPAVLALGAGVLQVQDVARLEAVLLRNRYFPPEALFALRNRTGQPVAVGVAVTNPDYAPPRQLDAAMPCFRLGAFGTEGYTHKRINGLFSFLAANTPDVGAYALDLLGFASQKVEATDVVTFAAQIPSDAPHLVRFYKSLFRRQGSFPIFEREL